MAAPPERGVQNNDALVAEGWVRRHLTDPQRAREAATTYSEAGFEVHIEQLEPSDFGLGCRDCAVHVCTSYVVVYTRKPEEQPT